MGTRVRLRRSFEGSPSGYLVSGPTSGIANQATTFTVSLIAPFSPTVITAHAANLDGSWSPTSLTLDSNTPSATIDYTPTVTGSRDLVFNNNRGLPDVTKSFFSQPPANEQAIVNAYIDNIRTRSAQWINTYPSPQAPTFFLYWNHNYDSMHTYWRIGQILQSIDPTLAQSCIQYAYDHFADIQTNYPNVMQEPPSGAPGYYNYNLGFRMLATEQSLSLTTQQRTDLRRVTAAYARSSTYSDPTYETYDPNWWIAYRDAVPNLTREVGLALLSHLVADSWYAEFETRTLNGMPLVTAHANYMLHILDIFFSTGGWMAQWTEIYNDLVAAGGDWTQVPESWTEVPQSVITEYSTWAWSHICRSWIFCYEDPIFTNAYNTQIQNAVINLCDYALAHWQKNSPGGRNCLMYRIADNGVEPPYGAPDLALFNMPMFAWAWSKTGNAAYYNMCVDLCNAANVEAAWYYPGKWFNELNLWTWYGLQWLNWVPGPFTPFWRP